MYVQGVEEKRKRKEKERKVGREEDGKERKKKGGTEKSYRGIFKVCNVFLNILGNAFYAF